MLLALWSGFWNLSDWTGGPVPPPVPTSEPGSGGGWRNYQRANDDYWEEREKQLRKFAPVHVEPRVVERFPEVEAIVVKRNEIAAKAPDMPNVAALGALSEHIAALDLQIEKFKVKCDEEALLALLL